MGEFIVPDRFLLLLNEVSHEALNATTRAASATSPALTPDPVRLVEEAAIDIKNRSFTITADVENPDGNVGGRQGMLATMGGETGGFAFMVTDGKPVFIYSYIGLEWYTITATETLPKGNCTIVFDFKYDGGGKGKGGTGTLSINGKKVGEGRIQKTVPTMFSTDDTFDVGEDWGTPVSSTYNCPAKFTGRLKKVTVEVN